MNIQFKTLFFILSLMLGLSACGGSGSGSDDTGSAGTTTISGTAATGAALASKTVTVVDANGAVVTTMTDATGKFSVTVTTSAKPFMLKVETNGDPLFSFAETGGGVVNITPMTNLALHEANKNGSNYTDLNALFTAFQANHGQITADELRDAKAKVNATLGVLFSGIGVTNSFDVFTTAFDADNSGIDAILDGVTIIITAGGAATNITIEIGGSTFTFDPTIDFSNFLPGGGSGSGSTTLPASVSGQILDMVFALATAGSPYNNADVIKFTFSSSGALMLTENFTVFAATFTKINDTRYEWDNGTHTYALSLVNGEIHEVDVSDSATNGPLGQFTPSSSGSGGGSGSGTNGLSFSVNGQDFSYTTFFSQQAKYGATDTVELFFEGANGKIVIPRELGTSNCNAYLLGASGFSYSGSAGNCQITVTSVSPLIATFSGKVKEAVFPFQADIDLTSGTLYLDTNFVSSNSSSIDANTPFTITYGGIALNAATCDPSALVTPTSTTLLGGTSDVYGWKGDVDEAGAFYELSLNKSGNTYTPGSINFRFVCASLSVSWQTSGTLDSLNITLDTASGLVNFNNTVIPFVQSGITTNDFPADTTIIPGSSLSITLNGTLAEI